MHDYLPHDLGKKMRPPSVLNAIPDNLKEEEPVHYPQLYLDSDESYDIPESGTMTVNFKRVSEVTRDEDGKISCCVTLDITKIVSVEADKSVRDETRGDRLDKLLREVQGLKADDADGEDE